MKELPNVGGDVRKVGYYTGIIVRLIFYRIVCQFLDRMAGICTLRGGSCYLVPVESPIGPYRTQTRPFVLPRGDNSFYSLVWFVALVRGANIEVFLYAHPQRCSSTY